jgi:hypothetical protein
MLRPQTSPSHQRPPLETGNIVGRAIIRLIGAVLLEADPPVKPEGRLWQLQHRYMQLEGMAELMAPTLEAELAQIPPLAA